MSHHKVYILVVFLLLVIETIESYNINGFKSRKCLTSWIASSPGRRSKEAASGPHWTKFGSTLLAGYLIGATILPSTVEAVPLGAHTTCAYPACTTQEEILKSNAPGLMSAKEKSDLAQDLRDMQFILDNAFLKMLAEDDYSSMRAGLRQSPMMNLRLTVRKYKDILDEPTKKDFMTKYSKIRI